MSSIYDKYNNRVAGFYTDTETNKQKPYIRISGTDFDLEELTKKLEQGNKYLIKYSGVYRLDDIEKDGKREIVSTPIHKENGMTLKGRYFLYNEEETSKLLNKDLSNDTLDTIDIKSDKKDLKNKNNKERE